MAETALTRCRGQESGDWLVRQAVQPEQLTFRQPRSILQVRLRQMQLQPQVPLMPLPASLDQACMLVQLTRHLRLHLWGLARPRPILQSKLQA